MKDLFCLKKGLAWRRIAGQGVIIDAERETIIGLSEQGIDWWEKLLADRPPEADRLEWDRFVGYLKALRLFSAPGAPPPEPSEDVQAPSRPPQVEWVEPFRPLAFTQSCALLPQQGGPCDQYKRFA